MPFCYVIHIFASTQLQQPYRLMEEKQINTRTLGGWLILIQIFIILNAISWVGNLQMFYGIYGEKDTLIKAQNIQDPGLYNAFIYYELAMSLLLTFGGFLVF